MNARTQRIVTQRIVPVLLSGGAGARLWPLSREDRPKQLLPLIGEGTLLQQTALRVRDPERFAPLTIIAAAQHRAVLGEQLAAIGVEPASVVLEPFGRNTAAAAAIAALLAEEEEPDALLLLMPADHRIRDPGRFSEALEAAAEPARAGALTLFGIAPDRPATGYGYIRAGAPLRPGAPARKVDAFVEKPARAVAESYLASGAYLWNSGIFLLSAGVLLEELARFEPAIIRQCRAALERGSREGAHIWLDPQSFDGCPSLSLDRAVMERTGRAAVVPATFGWTDVGSWSSLWELSDRDAAGNVVAGPVIAEDTGGSYLRSEGPLVATLGVDDLVVVATSDAVLIADKRRDQDVTRIVDRWNAQKARGAQ